jgi:hypothetical protein
MFSTKLSTLVMPISGENNLDTTKTGRILANAIRLGELPEMATIT